MVRTTTKRRRCKTARGRRLTDLEVALVRGLWLPLDGNRRYTFQQLATFMDTSDAEIRKCLERTDVEPVYGPEEPVKSPTPPANKPLTKRQLNAIRVEMNRGTVDHARLSRSLGVEQDVLVRTMKHLICHRKKNSKQIRYVELKPVECAHRHQSPKMTANQRTTGEMGRIEASAKAEMSQTLKDIRLSKWQPTETAKEAFQRKLKSIKK